MARRFAAKRNGLVWANSRQAAFTDRYPGGGQAMNELLGRISINPEICFGTIEEIVENYPQLKREDVLAAYGTAGIAVLRPPKGASMSLLKKLVSDLLGMLGSRADRRASLDRRDRSHSHSRQARAGGCRVTSGAYPQTPASASRARAPHR